MKTSLGQRLTELRKKKGWTQEHIDTYMKNYGTSIPEDVDSIIQLNCYRINPSDIESNPTMTGEYNIQRAIATFNKRVEPLLVVFKQEVRNGLLVKNPEDRPFFTKDQCELINGQPFDEGDQDKLEDVMEISDEEMLFWNRVGETPYHMYKDADTFMWKYVPKESLSHFETITTKDVPHTSDVL